MRRTTKLVAIGFFVVLASSTGFSADRNRNGVEDSLDLRPEDLALSIPERRESGTTPRSIATGDVNGDGLVDVVVAERHSNNIAIYPGSRDGGLRPAISLAMVNPSWVTVADLDGDGTDDIAATSTLTPRVRVFLRRPSGFEPRSFSAGEGSAPDYVRHGDFVGDGDQDLMVLRREPGDLAVFENDGLGGFSSPTTIGADTPDNVRLVYFAVADWDGDGDDDFGTVHTGAPSSGTLRPGRARRSRRRSPPQRAHPPRHCAQRAQRGLQPQRHSRRVRRTTTRARLQSERHSGRMRTRCSRGL